MVYSPLLFNVLAISIHRSSLIFQLLWYMWFLSYRQRCLLTHLTSSMSSGMVKRSVADGISRYWKWSRGRYPLRAVESDRATASFDCSPTVDAGRFYTWERATVTRVEPTIPSSTPRILEDELGHCMYGTFRPTVSAPFCPLCAITAWRLSRNRT